MRKVIIKIKKFSKFFFIRVLHIFEERRNQMSHIAALSGKNSLNLRFVLSFRSFLSYNIIVMFVVQTIPQFLSNIIILCLGNLKLKQNHEKKPVDLDLNNLNGDPTSHIQSYYDWLSIRTQQFNTCITCVLIFNFPFTDFFQ